MTETTQPDPAHEWAQAWLEDHPDARLADLQEAVAVVYGGEVADRVALDVWHADDSESHPNRPLTVADIPGGQGPASLFIAPDSTGTPRAYYKAADGDVTGWSFSADCRRGPDRALWDHLAATLPHVTVEEAP